MFDGELELWALVASSHVSGVSNLPTFRPARKTAQTARVLQFEHDRATELEPSRPRVAAAR
jgi:hypothetical protein